MFNRFLKPEIRYARRMARIARWDRPVEGLSGRVRAWAAHAAGRSRRLPRCSTSTSTRSPTGCGARPSRPRTRSRALKAEGVRTIVNLRGGREHGSWQLQKEVCERLGIELDRVRRPLPRRAGPGDACSPRRNSSTELDYPAVLHCKSGADRAGFVAALYLVVHRGQVHRRGPAPALHALRPFPLLEDRHPRRILRSLPPRGRGQGHPFLTWVETHYDPEALERDFRPSFWSSLLVDRIMRRE